MTWCKRDSKTPQNLNIFILNSTLARLNVDDESLKECVFKLYHNKDVWRIWTFHLRKSFVWRKKRKVLNVEFWEKKHVATNQWQWHNLFIVVVHNNPYRQWCIRFWYVFELLKGDVAFGEFVTANQNVCFFDRVFVQRFILGYKRLDWSWMLNVLPPSAFGLSCCSSCTSYVRTNDLKSILQLNDALEQLESTNQNSILKGP